MNKYNVIKCTTLYWAIQMFFLFHMQGFGNVLKIIAGIVWIICITAWIFNKKAYWLFYSASMILYSIVFTGLNAVLCLFFQQKTTFYIMMSSIILLNFLLSVGTLILLKKKKQVDE